LATPLYLEVQVQPHDSKTNFVEVRSVKVNIPQGTALPSGQLWLNGMENGTRQWLPLESLSEFGPRDPKSQATPVRTREGRAFELAPSAVVWCPNRVSPRDSPAACYAAEALFGVSAPMSGGSLSNSPNYLPPYGQGVGRVKTVFIEAQGQSERARIVGVQERILAAESRVARQALEAKGLTEQRALMARLADAPVGTQDFCNTGTMMLLGQGELVQPFKTLYCSSLGQVPLGVLRANGWDVQMTSRTTVQGMIGPGDVVDFAVTKRAVPLVSPPPNSTPTTGGKKVTRG
jgi:hypothetical protein